MNAIELCNQIRNAGGTPYFVGGCVRDQVLGLCPKDIDILVVGMNMAQLRDLFKVEPVGASFPVIIVDGIEIALARKERKICLGHDGFVCDVEGVTLAEDLFRRDLTINAMAIDPFSDNLIDPYGGFNDLRTGTLRPVSKHFKEDPLRVLRAARFAAQLNMGVSPELMLTAFDMGNELNTLTPERVWGELLKALQSNHPQKFFEALHIMGALEIVFPEIAALQGRIQPEKHHPEGDSYVHTLLVLERARELGADDETMFAAMVHDLGKAATDTSNLPHHYNHEALGVPLVESLCDRLRIPNSFRAAGVATAREHLNIHRFQDLRPVTKVRLLERLRAAQGNDLLERVCLAAQADAQGRGPILKKKPYPQRDIVLNAADKFRSIRGDQFAHLSPEVIRAKMEQARAKVL